MLFLVLLLLQTSSSLPRSTPDVVLENLAKIQLWNRDAGSRNMFAPNRFLDLTEDQMMDMHLTEDQMVLNTQEREAHEAAPEQEVGQGPPPSFDWRDYGAVSPPRSSRFGVSATLAAAVSTVESAYYRATGDLVPFSALEILQCSDDPSELVVAFTYIAQHQRLASLAGYGAPSKCAAASTENAMTGALVDKFSYLTAGSDYSLINAMMRYPILATVTATRQWQFYSSGVLSASRCPSGTPNHAVQIVAYTPGYYVAKNSWGSSWGEGGYIRLQRGQGLNPCGLLNTMVEPEVD